MPRPTPARKTQRTKLDERQHTMDVKKSDRLRRPQKEKDYRFDKLDAGDLVGNLTDTFDDDIELPRT